MREGLRSLIEKQPEMEVVGEAGDGRTTVRLVKRLSPDVVIMDITMPGMNGIEATRQITANFPGVKVVPLSTHSDRQFVLEVLRAGASGYVLKDCAFEELGRAIHAVASNQVYLSPGIANVVVESALTHEPTSDHQAFSGLTSREREVLQLLAEGESTKEIGFHLNLSAKTVESHRWKIMNKLGVHSVAELTKYAIREGLTSLED
jgi:DNA-binding NarL/FixJ family response regulator